MATCFVSASLARVILMVTLLWWRRIWALADAVAEGHFHHLVDCWDSGVVLYWILSQQDKVDLKLRLPWAGSEILLCFPILHFICLRNKLDIRQSIVIYLKTINFRLGPLNNHVWQINLQTLKSWREVKKVQKKCRTVTWIFIAYVFIQLCSRPDVKALFTTCHPSIWCGILWDLQISNLY